MCNSMASKPMRTARLAASTKAADMRHVEFAHGTRGVPVRAERDRRGCTRRPRIFAGRQSLAAFPRPLRRRLPPGMRKLDGELGAADAPAMRHDFLQRRLAGVGVKPKTAMGDAAGAFDVGGFDDQQTGAGIRQHTEMRHVPVVRHAVIGAVLAHRRDDDALGEIKIGEPERRKKCASHALSYRRQLLFCNGAMTRRGYSRTRKRFASSPTMPRRNDSTQTTKIAPWITSTH